MVQMNDQDLAGGRRSRRDSLTTQHSGLRLHQQRELYIRAKNEQSHVKNGKGKEKASNWRVGLCGDVSRFTQTILRRHI